MTDLAKLKAANARRWAAMQIEADKVAAIDATVRSLTAPAAKARYQAVATRTGVPWWVIAVIHEREASQSWKANIAQGDPWNEVSRHVPAGRGPFANWEDAAVDALTNCAPHAARWRDWSAGGALTLLEQYNGLGYAAMGVPSPYIWASTNQYAHGKYVADHVYRPDVVDHQVGCAALLKRMAVLDPSVTFDGAPQPAPQKPASVPSVKPAPQKPASSAAPGTSRKATAAAGAAAAGAGAAAAAHQAGLGSGTIALLAVLVIGAVAAVLIFGGKT